MFTVHYSIIYTDGVTNVVAHNKSPKKAFNQARIQAWADFEKANPRNWAHCWAHITNPYGKVVLNDFCD